MTTGRRPNGSAHYHETGHYATDAANLDDDWLMRDITKYEGGRDRELLVKREDHRAYRRACIREALARGLISEDPGGAP